jgi:hypothetical protein
MFVSSTFATFGPCVKELDGKNNSLSISGTNNKNKSNFNSTITIHLHSVVCIQNDTFVQDKQLEDHFQLNILRVSDWETPC